MADHRERLIAPIITPAIRLWVALVVGGMVLVDRLIRELED